MERIEAVTVEQVQELAQEIFRDELLSLALVGPYQDRDAFSSLLTFNR
jgi:predicted Zn-dependent peptidase